MAKIRKITLDHETGMGYIYLEEIKPGGSKHQVSLGKSMVLDFSESWDLLGIELLDTRITGVMRGQGLRDRLRNAGIVVEDL